MPSNDLHLKIQDELKKEHDMGPMAKYDLKNQEVQQIQVKIDNSVETAKFKPDKENPGLWYANELTFRAMRKDLFILGLQTFDVEDLSECKNCQATWDFQFWQSCPSCGGELAR